MNIFTHAAGARAAQQYITLTGDYLSHRRDSNPSDHCLGPYAERFQDAFLLQTPSGAISSGGGGGWNARRLIT
jgi:hypothetical protein